MASVNARTKSVKADGQNSARDAWRLHAPALAAWADKHMVNRRDAFGGYYKAKAADGGGTKQVTRKEPLALDVLARHFGATATDAVVGLHAISRDGDGGCWSRWGAADFDCHGDTDDAEANFRLALAVYEEAVRLGFRPLLYDSDGKGGLHLVLLFDAPVPTETVYRFMKWLVRGHKDHGLDGPPETFPKQRAVSDTHPFGNWLRLPGRHHTRKHFTRVWGGSAWLDGAAAIKAIVATRGAKVDAIPAEALIDPEPRRVAPAPKPPRERKPGDRWTDPELAVEALRRLPYSYLTDYDLWFKVGCALRQLDNEGCALWDDWSKGCPEKYEAGKCAAKWTTISADGGIHLGSLFAWAEDAGWVNPTKRQPFSAGVPNVNGNGRHHEPGEPPPAEAAHVEVAAVAVFSNFGDSETTDEQGRPKTVRTPRRMAEIADALNAITEGWPKRVGPMPFVEGGDGKPHWLDSPSKLFSWIDRRAQVVWTKGSAFITQERFYEDVRVNAESFDAIEICPHFPPMPRTYYMHEPVGRPGGVLEGLVDKFSPSTDIDRQLIEAFILTPFWGGQPGRRPAFLITGPDHDSENGRGLGKSTLVEILAQELAGGLVEVPPTGDMEAVKTRLLSPGAAYTRFARCDNVKTLRFSWAELEAVITSASISGKRLYQGEGTRPNTLVWAITVNGESLSEDLAQRCVQIKLKRPSYRAGWEAEVRGYIRENRDGLWADIKAALEGDRRAVDAAGRWADWEHGVLAATGDLDAAALELANRRDAMNADRRESDDFRCYVADRLKDLGHEPDNCFVFIPSLVMGEWLDRAERKKHATNQASARIRGFGIIELNKADTAAQRGWKWRGMDFRGEDEPTVIACNQAFSLPDRFVVP